MSVDVFAYDSYRKYLRDYYLAKKAKTPSFSYRVFAQAAGFESINYPKMIIDGKRNLTIPNIHRFCVALKLTPAQREYFETLVLLEQATTSAERAFYRRRFRALKKSAPQPKDKLLVQRHMLAHELFPAALLLMKDQPRDGVVDRLTKRLRIDSKIASDFVRFALEHALVVDTNGRLEENAEHYIFRSPQTADARRAFLQRQLTMSQRAFDSAYSKGAKFHSTTISCSPEAAADCRERIEAFIDATVAELSQTPSDELMQMNIQFFKLA